jgi:hypothetical protein
MYCCLSILVHLFYMTMVLQTGFCLMCLYDAKSFTKQLHYHIFNIDGSIVIYIKRSLMQEHLKKFAIGSYLGDF